ncbi:hypothetical protein [Citricoccus nitrophenolicus]|uniref:hypothetical protein n=1 Tax=Citricoccus nitrophenolicus TaxID=863575 RepID=UPI0031ED4D33
MTNTIEPENRRVEGRGWLIIIAAITMLCLLGVGFSGTYSVISGTVNAYQIDDSVTGDLKSLEQELTQLQDQGATVLPNGVLSDFPVSDEDTTLIVEEIGWGDFVVTGVNPNGAYSGLDYCGIDYLVSDGEFKQLSDKYECSESEAQRLAMIMGG